MTDAPDEPSPPPGYLGAGGPIRRGPAPELVEAGYALELADAPLLGRGLGFADLAHVTALDVMPDADRRALLGALVDLLDEEIAVDAQGDAYVTGATFSLSYPTTPGAVDSVADGSREVYVSKLNATGSALEKAGAKLKD